MITTETANPQLIHHALQWFGKVEKAGPESDDWVLAIIREMMPTAKDDSKVAWCSIFMNYVARNACAETTDRMDARSWLKVGEEVNSPIVGDVVIFWRGSRTGWQGHVGLYVNEMDGHINTLGGNQVNGVNIKGYAKSRLLGFRRLRHLAEPSETTKPTQP